MRVSLEWLAEFVEVPSVDKLVSALESAGIEVDEVHDPKSQYTQVVVGEVTACEKHPDADKLSVCKVSTGNASYDVVCGAPNVRTGQRVAYAQVGANLSGFKISARKIRGVPSQGMICAKDELGLADEKCEGIWELPSKFTLGANIFDEAKIQPALTLGLTPNRPDCLSHVGIAREIAAATNARLKTPTIRCTELGPDVSGLARVFVDDPAGCKRYVARVVSKLKVGPSPAWLQARLEAIGQRPINNVVDATNYVLHELGQPLHAFDLEKLTAHDNLPTVRAREAKEGEVIKTLDGDEHKLHSGELVIADAQNPVALAGVMGGFDSQVTESTTSVLLESAYFEPIRVRRSSKAHGLHTDSSHRFERGCDPEMTAKAIDRCAQLLVDVAEGEVAKGRIEVSQKFEKKPEVPLRPDRLERVLGVEIPKKDVVSLLEPLGIRAASQTDAALRFEIPSFRVDIEKEIDLVEEVARRYGYDKIPETLPGGSSSVDQSPVQVRAVEMARGALLGAGCSEVVSYGFGAPHIYEPFAGRAGEPVRIANPLGEEFSALRTTLLPHALQSVRHNLRHGAKGVRLFEIGMAFRQGRFGGDERDAKLPEQHEMVTVALCGGRHHGAWYEGGENIDFSDLAGVVESLVEALDPKGRLTKLPAQVSGFHPGVSAEVKVRSAGIGIAGQVHPKVAAAFDISQPVFVAELDLSALSQLQKRQIRYAPIPKFPGTRRDVAIVTDKKSPAETFRSFLMQHAGGPLGTEVVESVRLFDVYEGSSIPKGKVSLAFAIHYRSAAGTLTDDAVGEAFDGVLAKVTENFDVEIRKA